MFKILFSILPFVFAALLMPTFVILGRVKTRGQAIWAMVFLFCASKFVCFEALGGNAFAPELPEKVIWVWNWAYSWMCVLLAFTLLALPIRYIISLRFPFECWRIVWLIALPFLAALVAAVGVYNGCKAPKIKEVTIKSERVPKSLDGYKIVHLSDIHASSALRRWRTEKIVELANGAKADLICVTGDMSDGYSDKRRRDLEPIKNLTAKDGVYFVTGNHEYYFDSLNWRILFARWGLRILDNRSVFPREGLVIGGVNDIQCERVNDFKPDPAGVFNVATNGEFRILLQHRPKVDYSKIHNREYEYSADLQLSGHTHGGVMPGISYLVSKANGGFVKGLYKKEDGAFLYVSPGAGQWAGFPVRLFNDSEITIITLRTKK